MSIYDIEVTTITGEEETLSSYRDQVLLVVNTASKCGYTPQFEGLQALYDEFKEQGFSVLGFPCNQFAFQEPGTSDEIASFCMTHFSVSFPMHAKVKVNGPGTHPLFDHLKREAKGLLGTKLISWNFTKFLIDSDGRVVRRYGPKIKPSEIKTDIEQLIGKAN